MSLALEAAQSLSGNLPTLVEEIPVFVLGNSSLARNIVIYKALLEIRGRITNPISLSGRISPNRLVFVGVLKSSPRMPVISIRKLDRRWLSGFRNLFPLRR